MRERAMRKALPFAGLAAAVFGIPLMASPASAALCVTDSVAAYTALGATGCSVGEVTFFNIVVNTTVSGGGSVALGNFTPFTAFINGEFEYGLSLNYTANAGVPGAEA